MKISEKWLREWIDPPLTAEQLAEQLTMAGLEVGSMDRVESDFSGVVVGCVLSVEGHPDADSLSVCSVDVGAGETRQIVCGAPNVQSGNCYPVALSGARLPGGVKIRATKLRGVQSMGMLCSESELGLGQDSDGIMELAVDAPVGKPLQDYLSLDDTVLELDLTPNRGDCLSMQGVAREIAALNRLVFRAKSIADVSDQVANRLPVELLAPEACPIYLGRVIDGIDPAAVTPEWMRERLRRSGVRPLHPVVDVTNYVLLELGQPMHAFDLRKLDNGIKVRWAERGEKLVLLDEREVSLDTDVLVIADHSRPVAMAGVMGGLHSAVTHETRSIMLESAFFDPLAIAGRGRRHGLHTDASHRFERGVEPGLQWQAIQRATELIVQIAGGRPGPIEEARSDPDLPMRQPIELRRQRLASLLGLTVADDRVIEVLQGLGLMVAEVPGGWSATPPAHRFDLQIEADLIEEVARLVGYDEIPETPLPSAAIPMPVSESRIEVDHVRDRMAALGYQEAITYSFVDPNLQSLLFPNLTPLALSNPISSDLSVMRVSLWPGLLATLKENASRQQERVRIFECGVKFFPEETDIKEINSIAGLVTGERLPEQWGTQKHAADFFDIKSDIESILRLGRNFAGLSLRAETLDALHPGQSARVLLRGAPIGWVGALHPELQRKLGFKGQVFLFELDLDGVTTANVPAYVPISRYPRLRRDLAFVVPVSIPTSELLDCARAAAGELLAEIRLFDVYQGKGIDSGLKSVALGLILQESSRTLTDQEADDVVANVGQALRREFSASLRE